MPRSYPSDAIREAGSCAARVRRAFAAALASRLCLPATVCWTPGLPATCWLDHDDGFNHARVLTISGPKSCCLEAPLILRVSINSLAFNYERAVCRRLSWPTTPGDGQESPRWRYELSLLPEQLVDFVPWTAALAEAQAYQDESMLIAPPHPCHFWMRTGLKCDYAWTGAAWEVMEEHRKAEVIRQNHRRERNSA